MAHGGSFPTTLSSPPQALIQIVQECEQFSQWEPEARQDIAASQRLLLRKDDGFGEGSVDSDSPSPRIDEPDQATTRIEVFTYFSRHLPGRIAFTQHFNGKIGSEWKNRRASAAMVRQVERGK